jgi:hypothetical protein
MMWNANIVWYKSTCASLPRWVLEFAFQVSVSLEYEPIEKLNRSNRIRLYGLLKMIFLVWTLKCVKSTFGMEYDQRMIIKFLWNEKADGRDIANRLQTDCRQIAD